MSEFILSYWEGIEGGLGVKQEERCGFNIYWQIRDYVYAGVITGFVHNHNNQIVKNLNHMFFSVYLNKRNVTLYILSLPRRLQVVVLVKIESPLAFSLACVDLYSAAALRVWLFWFCLDPVVLLHYRCTLHFTGTLPPDQSHTSGV